MKASRDYAQAHTNLQVLRRAYDQHKLYFVVMAVHTQ